jgi:putative tryptophan/tyrosine transport system substrate-binding protein
MISTDREWLHRVENCHSPRVSEMALLSHIACSPSDREAEHEAARTHHSSRGAAVAWPFAVRAQQKALPVIGWLNPLSPGLTEPLLAAFRQGLSGSGYVGQGVAIEYRWAEGRYDRLPKLAADLVGRKVDVIAAFGSPSALVAKSAT